VTHLRSADEIGDISERTESLDAPENEAAKFAEDMEKEEENDQQPEKVHQA